MGKFVLGVLAAMVVIAIISITTHSDSVLLNGAFVGCILLLLVLGLAALFK